MSFTSWSRRESIFFRETINRLLNFRPGAGFLEMFIVTTASEHELRAAIDKMAEVARDFMVARVEVHDGEKREGERKRDR